ncbi:MAG: hypothetical protein U0271_13895 [Polyangiaceae bacterium]
MSTDEKHKWTFFRAGGVDQVVLKSGADIANLKSLDQKLWVALACPTRGLDLDHRTLDLVDTDKDQRVRAPEILEAVAWSGKAFASLDVLLEDGESVALAQFNKSTTEGKALKAGATRLLSDAGKKDAKEITLEDVENIAKVFVATRFNGDGIVPASTAEDSATQTLIEEIVATVGSSPDRSGKQGIDEKHLATFFEQAQAFVTWHDSGADLLVVGDRTAAAAAAVAAVESKVDDYFVRCRLAAFDKRSAELLDVSATSLTVIGGQELAHNNPEIRKLPLGRPEAGRALPLDGGINPAWSEEIATLKTAAIEPLLGARTTLSEADWRALIAKLAPYRAWAAGKPSHKVATLPVEHLREVLSGDARSRVESLIQQDKALEADYAQITSVEQAVRYRRHLRRLLQNFVNFADFYGRRGATFQAGTLYLDARSCDLVAYVNDPAKHVALAGLSSCYLAYLDITRPGEDKRHIVAAFTAGDTDNLMVGRNGVFYDHEGRDWDATVMNLIENPISVRQAFWTPYKRLIRLIEEQIAKRAAEKEKASSADIEKTAQTAANADQTKAPEPTKEPPKKVDVGTVAALSVAITGFATFISLLLDRFLGLGWLLPLGLLAIVLAISGPSMLIAWLKLRRRNLGPVLDANGWAINGRARINVPFGTSLTGLGRLPEGASRALADPFAEQPTPWRRYVVLVVMIGLPLLWLVGKTDAYLPDKFKASTVLHRTPTP